MQTLKVNYSGLFAGLERKPNSYRVIADNYEWVKRDVEQHIDQYYYDDFNRNFLRRLLQRENGKVVVECGCGLGGNLIPYTAKHRCIGLDFSQVALGKLRRYTDEMASSLADISAVPLKSGCADFVVLARVLFVHEDLELIVSILREAERILKPEGQIIIVNDFSSHGVRCLNRLKGWTQRLFKKLGGTENDDEFMLYYFSEEDMRLLLQKARLKLQNAELCNVHQGVYHLAYHNKLLGLLLRDNWHHYRIRHKDHWERMRLSRGINDAYPLGWIGRLLVFTTQRFWPSSTALSLCCVAGKESTSQYIAE